MFRAETRACRSAGFIQLNAGDDPTASPQEIKRHGNHRVGLQLKHGIEKFALARVFPDFILEKRLFAGEDHADKSGAERLLKLAHQLFGMRTGIPGGNKKLSGLLQQPDGSFVRAGLREPALNDLAHQRIQQGGKLLRLKPAGNPFEALGEDGLEVCKCRLRKNV